MPQSWAKDPSLASWVNNQRAYKKALDRGDPSLGMTAARAAKLEALGVAWDFPAAGDAASARDSDEGWTAPARRKKAAWRAGRPSAGGPSGAAEATAGLADALRGRGHGTEWEAQLARLVAYKAAHGDCNVPKRWAEDPRLATWVTTQRHRLKMKF